VTREPTLLKCLLQQRHWQKYGTFCVEYDNAARIVSPDLVGTWPSRAQLHRWLSGTIKSLPYPDHCRILERMFPGWTAEQLLSPRSDDQDATLSGIAANHTETTPGTTAPPTLDVSAVFCSRSEFIGSMSPHELFDAATEIAAAGLSLNLLCQQYPDQRLARLLENGTRLRCLFLDPNGTAIRAREHEEGHSRGHLSALTELNIGVLQRLRDRLTAPARERLEFYVYDETVRFNIVLVDRAICVMQPYLPETRGVDSPTFLIRRQNGQPGLYDVFEQVFDSLCGRSRTL